MSKFQLFNGEFLPEGLDLLTTDNRGFRYGDGFFESMRVANGSILQGLAHWHRLERTAAFLQMKLPVGLSRTTFTTFGQELCRRNGSVNARLRFKAYRTGSGTYHPESSEMGWCMTADPLPTAAFQLNQKGLNIGVFLGQSVMPAPLSNYKTSNSLPYVLATLQAQKMGWDDCIMTDSMGHIIEATGSNLFLVKGDSLLTPDLSTGGLQGVMRDQILKMSRDLGMNNQLKLLKEDDLMLADECFFTSSIRGIQWVAACGKKRYFHKVAERLLNELNVRNKLSSIVDPLGG